MLTSDYYLTLCPFESQPGLAHSLARVVRLALGAKCPKTE